MRSLKYQQIGLILSILGALGATNADVRAESPPGHARGYACSRSKLTVYSVEPSIAERVCDVVAETDPVLSECGLPDYNPLTLYVVKRIEGTQAHCLGAYVCDTNEIAILDPAVLSDAGQPKSDFDAIAPSALFDSLVVHEMTHARLSQLPNSGEIGTVNHEYIAYAMQLEALSTDERNAFLIEYADRQLDVAAINVFTLSFAPGLFASLAWRHFDQAGNGCGFVQSLIDRSFSFEIPID